MGKICRTRDEQTYCNQAKEKLVDLFFALFARSGQEQMIQINEEHFKAFDSTVVPGSGQMTKSIIKIFDSQLWMNEVELKLIG
ncbi:hypothetical protein T07_14483 [Trichinella nelsoni]|uniref:Uncharacterized protein n=1 Tax=Trichinella nelsoni TaxID=6336 RepID=A0A0V0RQN5_9BILA|nr:hypothetical protein T07_14483 [Trichinella nelsoni]